MNYLIITLQRKTSKNFWVLKFKQLFRWVFSFCRGSPFGHTLESMTTMGVICLGDRALEQTPGEGRKSSVLGSCWSEGVPCLVQHSVSPLYSPKQLEYKLQHDIPLLPSMVRLIYKDWLTFRINDWGKPTNSTSRRFTPEKIHCRQNKSSEHVCFTWITKGHNTIPKKKSNGRHRNENFGW